MAAKDGTTDQQLTGSSDQAAGSIGVGSAKDSGTGDTGRAAGRTGRRTTSTEGIQVVAPGQLSELDTVNPPPGNIPAPKRGRGRPPGSSSKKSASTPNKPKTSKSPEVSKNADMVKTLIGTAFHMTALRLGEHWRIDEDEADALAQPIAAIMDRHALTEKIAPSSDYLALLCAVLMIVLPKITHQMDVSRAARAARPPRKEVRHPHVQVPIQEQREQTQQVQSKTATERAGITQSRASIEYHEPGEQSASGTRTDYAPGLSAELNITAF